MHQTDSRRKETNHGMCVCEREKCLIFHSTGTVMQNILLLKIILKFFSFPVSLHLTSYSRYGKEKKTVNENVYCRYNVSKMYVRMCTLQKNTRKTLTRIAIRTSNSFLIFLKFMNCKRGLKDWENA